MVRQDLGYHERDASSGWDMQELVGAMRVGVGSEHTSDDELRLREFFAEHRHKRDTAAFPHVGGRRSEGDLGAVREGLFEPRRQGRGIPPGGARSRLKLDPRAVGRVFSNNVRTMVPAVAASKVGGSLRLSFATVEGSSTLPGLGNPSMPMTANCGRQVRLSTSSVNSSVIGDMPGTNGDLV